MSDEVIGVAILDKREEPHYLSMFCQSARGRISTATIPVYPKGAEKPANNAWEYEIANDILNITPSLHIRSKIEETWVTDFHNGFNWSVKFKLVEDPIDLEIPKGRSLYEQLHKENPDIHET